MAAPRRFDHDEARRLAAAGETPRQIAERFGVSVEAIRRVVNVAYGERRRQSASRWHAAQRTPCKGGCGRLVWNHFGSSRQITGYCHSCLGVARNVVRHGTETEYSQGCRCDACREAARVARAARRERRKVACKNCGKPRLHPNDSLTTRRGLTNTGLCLDCYRQSMRATDNALSPSKEKETSAA